MQTNPETPVKDTAQSGSSFGEVLASTSQPSTPVAQTPVSPVLRFGSHNDSETATKQDATEGHATQQKPGSTDGMNVQVTGAFEKNPAATHTPSVPAQSQTTTNGGTASCMTTSRSTAVRDERSPISTTVLAAKIAATVVLPSVALVATAGTAVAPPLPTPNVSTPVAQPSSEERQGGPAIDRSHGAGNVIAMPRSNANSTTLFAMAAPAIPPSATVMTAAAMRSAETDQTSDLGSAIGAAAGARVSGTYSVPVAANAPAVQDSSAQATSPDKSSAPVGESSDLSGVISAAIAARVSNTYSAVAAVTAPSASAPSAQKIPAAKASSPVNEARAGAASGSMAGASAARFVKLAVPAAQAITVTASQATPAETSSALGHDASAGTNAAAATRGSNANFADSTVQQKSQTATAKPTDATLAQNADGDAASQTAVPGNEAGAALSQAGSAVATQSDSIMAGMIDGLAGQAIPLNLSAASTTQDAGQPANKTAQNGNGVDVSFGKAVNSGSVSNASSSGNGSKTVVGTGSAMGPTSASPSQTVLNAGNGNQTSQHAQGDGSQAPAQSKVVDGAAAPVPFVVTQNAEHDSATAHVKADSASDSIRTADPAFQAQSAETAPASGINTARVIQNMSESEMRVGMHSAEFGDISIRTSVSMQQMTAQISVDHSDLGKAISAHIPAMQEKLGGESGLRATVEVNSGGMSFSDERGYSGQREAKTAAPVAHFDSNQDSSQGSSLGSTDSDYPVLRATAMSGDGSRLDIQA